MEEVPASRLMGNLALVSHPGNRESRKRYWFRDLTVQGPRIDYLPERSFGPVLNTFYSIAGNTLKLSAQFPPLGFRDGWEAVLEVKDPASDTWEAVSRAKIDAHSFVAVFRGEDYDASLPGSYRVGYMLDGGMYHYEGLLQAEPLQRIQ